LSQLRKKIIKIILIYKFKYIFYCLVNTIFSNIYLGRVITMTRIRHRVTDKGIIAFNTDPSDTSGNEGLGAGAQSLGTISTNTQLTPDAVGKTYVLSGSSALTVPLPAASAVPGGQFVFRVGSVHAHALISGSAETTIRPFTDGTDNGGKITLENVVGSSVILVSDGANYLVTGNSGSLTLA
jgi:hypothetical protein